MIKIFKTFTPQTIIILLFFAVVMKLGYILQPINLQSFIENNNSDWLSEMIFEYFKNNHRTLVFLSIVLIIFQSFIINRICITYKLFQQESFVPSAIFILLTSLNPWFNILSAPLITSTIILFTINNILRIQSTSMPNKLMYNSGLFIGLSTIFYWPNVVLLPFAIWAYAVTKKPNLREILALILGIITTLYVIITGSYLLDYDFSAVISTTINFQIPSKDFITNNWLSITSITLLISTSLFVLNKYFSKMIESTKKMWWSILIFLFMGIGIPFVLWKDEPLNWYFFLIPASIIISNIWLSDCNRWLRIAFFWLTIGSAITIQYNLI